MSRLRFLLVLLLLGVAAPTGAEKFLVRVLPGDLLPVLERQELTLEEEVPDPDGELYLVSGEDSLSLALIADDPSVLAVEVVEELVVPEIDLEEVEASSDPLLDALRDTSQVDFYGVDVWTGYVEQAAVDVVSAEEARDEATGKDMVIAVIDTGVDPEHPILAPSLLAGYDFTRDQPGTASEWPDLDPEVAAELRQSVAWILDDAQVAVLDQSVAWILDQSVAWILDGERLPSAFGHGTMVAGIVHLIAPKAKIMPLKAFTADGTAETADIVRAIYHAVEHGADVINMSFSLGTFSAEILRAVNYAARQGVVSVASVGNNGTETLVYPAALGLVIGVGSTTHDDQRSDFSNYGEDLVTLAAPGEAIVTTFPGGGSYAAGWGTSYSTPMVAGAVALWLDSMEMEEVAPEELPSAVMERLRHCEELAGLGLGYGRLNAAAELDD